MSLLSALLHGYQDLISRIKDSILNLRPEKIEERIGLVGFVMLAILYTYLVLVSEVRIKHLDSIASALVLAHFSHEQ